MTRIRTLVTKELLDLMRNRTALLPVALVTLISLVLPFVIIVAIPAFTGERLGRDQELTRVSAIAGASGLTADGRIQFFLFQQFLLLFLLTPITGAMALAAHSVIGEKQARTLEPLLATPITTIELLVAKVVGSLLPTLAISLAGLLIYFAEILLFAAPGVLRAMLTARTAILVFVVGPAAALVALQFAIVVSSRVNDARTAQQFGVLIIIPLTALLVGQFTGAMWLSTSTMALIGLGLFAGWIVLVWISAALFERESILTRWR